MDNPRNKPLTRRDDGDLGLRPLNARSVILSVLLGSHPPEMPVAALVALGRELGVPAGTLRTALSRMTADGEVVAAGGRYRLSARLIARQRQQDTGRSVAASDWNGDWWVATVAGGPRPVADRRRIRSAMVGARLGELRPGTWMRPANIEVEPDAFGIGAAPDAPASDATAPDAPALVIVCGPLHAGEPARLAAALWDLDAIEARAARLDGALAAATEQLERGAAGALAPAFATFAACLRLLRSEPQLPVELADSPRAHALRRRYGEAEPVLQGRLRAITREALSTAER